MILLYLAAQPLQPVAVAPSTTKIAVAPSLERRREMIDQAHALLGRAERARNLYRPGATGGQLSKAELDSTIAQTKDSLADMDQMDQLRLQMAMDRLSKLMSTLSNMLKKMSDTDAGITNNIK